MNQLIIQLTLLKDHYNVFLNNKYLLVDNMLFNSFYIFNETLKVVHHKLYINWINLRPINFLNIVESKLYKITNNDLKKLSELITINSINILNENNKENLKRIDKKIQIK